MYTQKGSSHFCTELLGSKIVHRILKLFFVSLGGRGGGYRRIKFWENIGNKSNYLISIFFSDL